MSLRYDITRVITEVVCSPEVNSHLSDCTMLLAYILQSQNKIY